MTIETGNGYGWAMSFLTSAQIAIEKSSFNPAAIEDVRSCVKLAMPHFTGGKVLMKSIFDGELEIVMQLFFSN
jgi:hypothetical protein